MNFLIELVVFSGFFKMHDSFSDHQIFEIFFSADLIENLSSDKIWDEFLSKILLK